MKSPATEYCEAYELRKRKLKAELIKLLPQIELTTRFPDETWSMLKSISVADVVGITTIKEECALD